MQDPIACRILGFPSQELHFQDVSLDENKCTRYLSLLSPTRRVEAKTVLDATTIISTRECMDRLRTQVDLFLAGIRGEVFYVHITVYKIGSEHMFLYLFRDLFLLHNFGGFFCSETPPDMLPQFKALRTVEELFSDLPTEQKIHLLRMDDAMYSGVQIFGILDEAEYRVRRQYGSSSGMIWHVCVAFSGMEASTWLPREFAKRMPLHLYISHLVPDIALPSAPWKMSEYTESESYVATPLFFAHKLSLDYRTTFSQIYVEGYNPDTEEETGSLVSHIPDRKNFDYIQSLFSQEG